MNAGEEWTERRRRGTTTVPQQSQPPHAVDADACSTLRGLERLSADLCRSLGGVSARPSAVSDPLLPLQRHFSALTKFAPVETQFCGRK